MTNKLMIFGLLIISILMVNPAQSNFTYEDAMLSNIKFINYSISSDYIPQDSFDWRDKDGQNWITPIEKQGACNSCWAFSALDIIETAIKLHYNDPTMDIDLSEQYMISDCTDTGNCAGGRQGRVLYYARNIGIPEEKDYPYIDVDSECDQQPIENYTWKIENIIVLRVLYEDNKTETYKSALHEYGPLATTLCISSDWYHEDYTGEPPTPMWADHGIVIVGYNDTGGYWIVKNSRGDTWGDDRDGYGKVLYGDIERHGYAYVVDGIIPPTRIPGDITGDGKINIGDAVLLFNWVSFPNEQGTTYVLNKPDNADVNDDGRVSIGDAVLLFNWVSFPNERGTTYILR